MANPNASWLYKTGLLTIKGTSTAPNPGAMIGLTTPETILSVLNTLAYGDSKKVMMEIGSFNTNIGNYGTFYKYQFGYINSSNGSDGRFTIQGCPVSTNVYTNTDPPVTLLELSKVNLRLSVPLQFLTNTWNTSTDGYNRLYFLSNSHTYIGSADQWLFQNTAGANVVSITSGGNISAQAITATSGAISNGLNVTGQTNLYGNVYSSGIFSGNGSGLTNISASYANTAGSANSAPDGVVYSTGDSFNPPGDRNNVVFNLPMPTAPGLYYFFIYSRDNNVRQLWYIYFIQVTYNSKNGGGVSYLEIQKLQTGDHWYSRLYQISDGSLLTHMQNHPFVEYAFPVLFAVDQWYAGNDSGDPYYFRASYRRVA